MAVSLVLCCLFMTGIAAAASDNPEFSCKSGLYLELGGRAEPDTVGGECGLFMYTSENMSTVFGLAFLASEGFDDIFTGASLGIRFSTDSRISPFIGMGVFGGYSKEEVKAEHDRIDNDEDEFIDEPGETKEVIKDVIGSIYPEIGLHVWCNDRTRLTVTGKYYITTEGREYDFWLYNLGIAISFN